MDEKSARNERGARTDLDCPKCGARTQTLWVRQPRVAGKDVAPQSIGRVCSRCPYQALTETTLDRPDCAHEEVQAITYKGPRPRRAWISWGLRCRTCHMLFRDEGAEPTL